MAAPQPTLAGFFDFIRNVMGITTEYLPDDSPYPPFALAVAMGLVNRQLAAVCIPSADAAGVALNTGGITVYVLCVYNLAGDNLVNYAQDQNGETFFKDMRKQFNLLGFVSGVIQSSSDESTSQSLVVMEAAKAFTLANLQQLKTPWGRQYLALAQSYGPTPIGIT